MRSVSACACSNDHIHALANRSLTFAEHVFPSPDFLNHPARIGFHPRHRIHPLADRLFPFAELLNLFRECVRAFE